MELGGILRSMSLRLVGILVLAFGLGLIPFMHSVNKNKDTPIEEKASLAPQNSEILSDIETPRRSSPRSSIDTRVRALREVQTNSYPSSQESVEDVSSVEGDFEFPRENSEILILENRLNSIKEGLRSEGREVLQAAVRNPESEFSRVLIQIQSKKN